MAFSATTVHPVIQHAAPEAKIGNDMATSLLSALLLSVYAAQKGSKSLRKLKSKMAWTMIKGKVKSLFSKKVDGVSNRTLIYIILGVVFIVLLVISPIAALALAILLLILLLAHVI